MPWNALRHTAILAVTFVVLAPAAHGRAYAQEGRLAALDPDSVITAAHAGLPGTPLSFDDAVARALASSPRLAEARGGLAASEGSLRQERGAFDPELFLDAEVADAETPTSSSFGGAPVLEERTVTSAFGARTRLPFGTELTASVDASKFETNSIYQSLDPEYRTLGQLELRQPLLRGFGPGTRGPLSAAEHRAAAELARFHQAEFDLRADLAVSYWELYAAERDFVVQQLIVDQANALLEQARVRASAGILGPDQVASARVFVAQQRLVLLDQEERLAASSDRLAELVGPPPEASGRYHTIDDPEAHDGLRFAAETLDASTLFALAREENRTLRAAREELAALEASARSGRWNALPALDLVGAIGGNGLSGKGLLGGTGLGRGEDGGERLVDSGLGDALDQSLGREYPTWALGLELTFPLGLRAGRGERDRASAEAMRQQSRIAQLERSLESELRDALRRYENGTVRLELAREGVAAAREQVRIGLIEFENGRSTAFELVRLAADLASSQQELSRALVRTTTARADLYRLVGPREEGRSEHLGGNR